MAKKIVAVYAVANGNGPVMHKLREDGWTGCGHDPGTERFAGPGTKGLLSRKKAKKLPGVHKHQHPACFG